MIRLIAYLSARHLRFRSEKPGVSIVASIAFLTILVGSAAGLVTLSAVNGIHARFIEKLTAKDAHITFLGTGKGIRDYGQYQEKLRMIPGVLSAEPFYEGRALLKGDDTRASSVMGITETTYRDIKFKQQFSLLSGTFDLSRPNSIIIGDQLAFQIGATNGSIIMLMVYHEGTSGDLFPFRVTGIVSMGYAEYDSTLAMISFDDSQKIFDLQGFAYGIGIRVKDPLQVEKYIQPARQVCPFYMYTWKTINRNNLYALNDEKMLIQIILVFFFIVIGFNILSAMLGLALDKKEETGILKAMGFQPGSALRLFLLDGFILGIAGSTAGILTGLVLSAGLNPFLTSLEKLFNSLNFLSYHLVSLFKTIPQPTAFQFFSSGGYLGRFPMIIQYTDILFLLILSVTLSMIAVIPPALKAMRLRPAEVLRNE